MLDQLKKRLNRTYTENGAVTLKTTQSACLDLFAAIGALRHANDSEVLTRFQSAYYENADLAVKTLFYARDIRGGLGERKVPRIIYSWLAKNHKETIQKNLHNIIEFGRYDDLIVLLDTPCKQEVVQLIKEQLNVDRQALNDNKQVSLLAKWLPSVNASNAETIKNGKIIAHELGMTDKAYRKLLVMLRAQIKIIENNLREKDYTFDYETQPSKALFQYRQAFMRNDQVRYENYLNRVMNGEAAMNTGTLTPYDIIQPVFSGEALSEGNKKAMDVTWNAQEDFTGDENALVVLDGSGSMYYHNDPKPIAVAESLAIYFAERNIGEFQNHFITFSTNPKLVEIHGKSIVDKVQYCSNYNECGNTNIQKVFDVILETAIAHEIPQREMPTNLYIISDMEFDCCTDDASLTNFEYAKRMFHKHGYTLPQVVFWNVDSRNRQQPVERNEQGVCLVSGSSPRIFSMIAKKTLSPYAFMMETLGVERYQGIVA